MTGPLLFTRGMTALPGWATTTSPTAPTTARSPSTPGWTTPLCRASTTSRSAATPAHSPSTPVATVPPSPAATTARPAATPAPSPSTRVPTAPPSRAATTSRRAGTAARSPSSTAARPAPSRARRARGTRESAFEGTTAAALGKFLRLSCAGTAGAARRCSRSPACRSAARPHVPRGIYVVLAEPNGNNPVGLRVCACGGEVWGARTRAWSVAGC
mmetsp:Transcript_39220/g.103787  ORF Transcript_39220/g.103787 Transcript_39220/m.103787 type:complete len:215 (+) Transcript_39220:303-947(+)